MNRRIVITEYNGYIEVQVTNPDLITLTIKDDDQRLLEYVMNCIDKVVWNDFSEAKIKPLNCK